MTKDTKNESVSGGRWGVFQRFDIKDIGGDNTVYLRRWYLIKTPVFGIYLHQIRRPDHDRNLHDHPWSFFSLVLKGGYMEQKHDRHGVLAFKRRTFTNWMRKGEYHRIHALHRVPTWTLVFVGRRRSSWGFLENGVHVDKDDYFRGGTGTGNSTRLAQEQASE